MRDSDDDDDDDDDDDGNRRKHISRIYYLLIFVPCREFWVDSIQTTTSTTLHLSSCPPTIKYSTLR